MSAEAISAYFRLFPLILTRFRLISVGFNASLLLRQPYAVDENAST